MYSTRSDAEQDRAIQINIVIKYRILRYSTHYAYLEGNEFIQLHLITIKHFKGEVLSLTQVEELGRSY